MKPLKLVLALLATAALTGAAQVQPRQSVGLVLSGGGAKGIAHIGIIQALEENDIPIDYVTGTSMGAIVGGLYAAGYTPDEMLDMISSRGFSYWSTGKIDPQLTFYFNREQPSPAMFSTTLGGNDTDNNVPASLISGQPMSFAFMDLFSAYTAQCNKDFDKLFVPFRCVASDVSAHRKHVFSSGSLGDAIRASMTFPIVFQPIAIDSVYYYDGGIYDNFPVDVMREDFAPSVMIGVDVSTPSNGPQTSLMDQLEDLIIQGHDPTLPDNEGIKIHIDLRKFSLLDFPKAREIYEIGYRRGLEMIDSIKGRITARTPAMTRNLHRAVFKSQSPYVRFGQVNVSGGNRHQNEYISYLFAPASGCDTLGISRARDAYYRAISSGKLRDLFPQAEYNDSTDLFALNLKASVKGNLKGSVGGFISSSTSSFLYAALNYSTLSFSSLNAGLEGWIGQTTMAAVLNGRMYLHTTLPSAIGAQVVVSREKFYQNEHAFYEDKYPTFIIDHEYFARAMWSVAAGRRGAFDIGVGYGALRNSFYKNINFSTGRAHSDYNLGQALMRYTASTLDEVTFPTSGYSINATAMGLMGNNHTYDETDNSRINSTPKWAQLELQSRCYPNFGQHFALGMEADVMMSTRKLLSTYSASIATAPLFAPTPSAHNAFRAQFRANSFIGAGLIPIYKINPNLSTRLGGYAFIPMRRIIEVDNDIPRYGNWFGSAEFFGEADITYHFPFGSLTGYANYSSGAGAEWNFGISFGVFILPPKFLR